MSYVVVHGLHTSCKPAHEYVAHIVYGNPRVDAVTVGGHLVALCEFADAQDAQAAATFERMSSFSLGAQLVGNDRALALREFGAWVYHYAPGTFVGLPES